MRGFRLIAIVHARRTGNRDDKLGVTLCKWDISLAVEMPSCQMKPRPLVPPNALLPVLQRLFNTLVEIASSVSEHAAPPRSYLAYWLNHSVRSF
jgi:hypothetical protein